MLSATAPAGFCVFNDCGVAVNAARGYGIRRIAYVDIDAHHATACSTRSRNDPDLISATRMRDGRHYTRATGAATETGRGAAAGTKLNLPLPPGAGDAEF